MDIETNLSEQAGLAQLRMHDNSSRYSESARPLIGVSPNTSFTLTLQSAGRAIERPPRAPQLKNYKALPTPGPQQTLYGEKAECMLGQSKRTYIGPTPSNFL